MIIKFEDLTTTQKGTLGEKLVDGILRSIGAQLYSPMTNGAHYCDRLFISNQFGIFGADAKSKASRSAYRDQGIDRRHFDKYQAIMRTNNIQFMLFFVDENFRCVYGNYLSKLLTPKQVVNHWRPGFDEYPMFDNNNYSPMVYFPLENMVKFGEIDEQTCWQLKQLSCRSYNYPDYSCPVWLS